MLGMYASTGDRTKHKYPTKCPGVFSCLFVGGSITLGRNIWYKLSYCGGSADRSFNCVYKLKLALAVAYGSTANAINNTMFYSIVNTVPVVHYNVTL